MCKNPSAASLKNLVLNQSDIIDIRDCYEKTGIKQF